MKIMEILFSLIAGIFMLSIGLGLPYIVFTRSIIDPITGVLALTMSLIVLSPLIGKWIDKLRKDQEFEDSLKHKF